ncbi:MAG: hypothetical protein LUQ66_07045 [Methanoregula sp.]|nr:hypothetical protein [Methanoregula sp.]
MNTGIIMIGLAFVMLSVALMVSPSDAARPDTYCSPCCGSGVFTGDDCSVQIISGTEGIVEKSTTPVTFATDRLPVQ